MSILKMALVSLDIGNSSPGLGVDHGHIVIVGSLYRMSIHAKLGGASASASDHQLRRPEEASIN